MEEHERVKRKSFEKGFSFKDAKPDANKSASTTPTAASLTARSLATLTARTTASSGNKGKGESSSCRLYGQWLFTLLTHPVNPLYYPILSPHPVNTLSHLPLLILLSLLISSTAPDASEKSNLSNLSGVGDDKRVKRNTMNDYFISTTQQNSGKGTKEKEPSPSHKISSPTAAGGGGGGGDKATGEKKKRHKRKSLDEFASKYG